MVGSMSPGALYLTSGLTTKIRFDVLGAQRTGRAGIGAGTTSASGEQHQGENNREERPWD